MNAFLKGALIGGGMLLSAATVYAYNSTSWFQRGYPGVAMETFDSNERLAQKVKDNVVPPSLPPASPDGPKSVDAYKNVQVLGHLSVGEMTRLMAQMTTWVAPNQGCAYCHAPMKNPDGSVMKDAEGYVIADPNNLHSDEVYAKVVARRMLQMTWHINSKWKPHVKETGVTCYTCHRGNPVPKGIWYDDEPLTKNRRLIGDDAGQNKPSVAMGYTSLPRDGLSRYLVGNADIRVQGTEALPHENYASIKQTEGTYGLMMHMSTSLGVNCTYCHNSRSMGSWETSPSQRASAWYGIRMARDLNNNYIMPLGKVLPAERMGPTGDAPKLACNTCHAGAYKPLLGVSMLGSHPELLEAKPQPQKMAAAGGEFATQLPGGVEVKGNATGVESKLLAFIQDDAQAVDKETWFTFDRLLFKTGSAELDAESSAAQLTNIAEILKAYPKVELKIGGYTDNVGDPAANKTLSQQRADNVAAAIAALGIDAARLSPEGYGQEHPVCTTDDSEACRAQNRRIDVRVRAK